MTKLLPDERLLVGNWIEKDGKIVADGTAQRIDRLTNGILEVVQDHPRSGGWRRLFRDRADGRFWERFYPEGEVHGGGPPSLRCIGVDQIAREYQFNAHEPD